MYCETQGELYTIDDIARHQAPGQSKQRYPNYCIKFLDFLFLYKYTQKNVFEVGTYFSKILKYPSDYTYFVTRTNDFEVALQNHFSKYSWIHLFSWLVVFCFFKSPTCYLYSLNGGSVCLYVCFSITLERVRFPGKLFHWNNI